jgi:hypothetical protein
MTRFAKTDLDVAFSLLADRRRRTVLYHLLYESEPADFEALVEAVATREAKHTGAATDEDRRNVELSLQHVHLPALDRAGVVRLSADGTRVELVDAGLVAPFLDEAARLEGPGAARPREDLDPVDGADASR